MWFQGMLFLAAVGLSQFVNAKDADIQIVTEEAFPLQYRVGGELYGPTVDIVKLVLAEAELSYQVNVLPWARAYELAKHKPNTLIFSMARTQEREHQFYWIGEVTRIQYYFYTTAEFASSHNITPESAKHLKIGSVRNSATYQYLKKNGFKKVFPVSAPGQNYDKLLNGRIDMFPASRSTFELACADARDDCDRFIPVMPMGLPATSLYFALSKQTPIAIVDKVRQAYKQVTDTEESAAVLTDELETSN